MRRRFLTFRRFCSHLWDFFTPPAFLYIAYRIFPSYPTVSKGFALFALIDAFVTGLKIGYSYHKWLIHRENDDRRYQ